LFQAIATLWAPPPKLTISEWSDQRRFLPSESAAEPGKWRTSRAEYQRGMMDAISDPSVEVVVVMSSAQVGKSEALNNALGFYADCDPCPIMMLQPTIKMGEDYSKDRIAPMIRDTPALRPKFGDARSRDSGNTLLHKQFPGGHLTIAGAESPASLASRPIRVLLADEVDRYPDSAGTEGDPVKLAEKRTTTFWNRKIILTSTPTVKGFSRIEAAFLETDQRYYHVPCPCCGHAHRLTWANVVWGKGTPADGDPEKAVFKCPSCSGHFTDTQKDQSVRKGQWVATAPFKRKAGFHLSELYSPWKRLRETVAEFLESKGNPERMRVWVNTALGETYEADGDSLDESDLEARAEKYAAEVPGRVLFLTVGADTQPDRIEAECIGWGAGDESWSIEYAVFHGDPDIGEGQNGSPWQAFTDWIRKKRKHESGLDMDVSCTCLDTGGHNTQSVYNYVKRHRGDRIFGIKGYSGWDRPIIGQVTRKRSGKKIGRPIDLYPVGADNAKYTVVTRLRIAEPGPGYCHFPTGRNPEWFQQLASEKLVTEYKKGRAVRAWVPIPGRRNEALDVRGYGTAALLLANPQFDKLAFRMKQQIAAMAPKARKPEPEEEPLFGETEASEGATQAGDETPAPVKDARKNPVRRRRGGFIRSW
jgi:phage terminase large subunit GpA-like protein